MVRNLSGGESRGFKYPSRPTITFSEEHQLEVIWSLIPSRGK